MSTLLPPKPRQVLGAKRYFPLVVSQWNPIYVQGLVNHVTDELRNLAPSGIVTLHQVPGSFEIPVVVRELAAQKRADAIIAIGVILKGSTSHADHIAQAVTNALQQIAIEHGVPVIHTVLSVDNEEQARERCLEKKMNRGTEAAHAAIQISNVMAELRAK
jgi:6,7-dimethyl-8-ribityllumazine synthase